MRKHKVSVIIPVFGVEKHIRQCAISMFEQTMPDLEIIFVDDCTLDDSIHIIEDTLERYPERKSQTKIIHHPENRGLVPARFTGVAESTGDYIIFCDGDDWADTTMYQKMYDRLHETGADACLCDFQLYFNDKKRKAYRHTDFKGDHEKFLKKYCGEEWATIWSVMARRSLYGHPDVRPPAGCTFSEDFWTTFKLFYYSKKLTNIHEPLYHYNRMNVQSMICQQNRKTELEERTIVIGIIDFLKEKNDLSPYLKPLSWRILKNKQYHVLYPEEQHEFQNVFPESHAYIWSCPFCGIKIKFIMWTFTHHLKPITDMIIWLRKALNR